MQTFIPSGEHSSASGLFASLLPAIAPKSFKAALADEIERMIDILDQLDGDPDFEPDLAGTPNCGAACDAEGDNSELELNGDELDGPDADREPSLGSLGGTAASFFGVVSMPMPHWAGGNAGGTDLESDGDCDIEDGHDAEMDPAESGIGDEEGLEEQTGLFDRSGEEPDQPPRPYCYEEDVASRRMCASLVQQASTLAERVNGGASSSARVVRL